jgi:hypothetical protein
MLNAYYSLIRNCYKLGKNSVPRYVRPARGKFTYAYITTDTDFSGITQTNSLLSVSG